MPKSRRRKISNYRRIQARNRKARAYARMEERALAKEEVKTEEPPIEEPPAVESEVCAATP